MTRSFKGIAWLGAFAGCLLSVETAFAEPTVPAAWLSTQVNESGQHCSALAEQRQGDKWFVACGAAGAWEISLAAD